jgi:hypothetical protein
MKLLEQSRVHLLELPERHRAESRVTLLHGGKRVLRAAAVIEERVVEVEENGSDHHWIFPGPIEKAPTPA